MGGTVGCDAVDGAVFERLDEGGAVFLASNGRVDLAVGVVREQRFVGEREVVRRSPRPRPSCLATWLLGKQSARGHHAGDAAT